MLWWRYRDNIFDIRTHGLPKLLEFTNYINGLYPTIKFELVYSDSHLNVLDLTLHLRNGFISSHVLAKPTDSHLYLPFLSSHPVQCKRADPFGVALRIKRNCSTDDFLQNRCKEYKGYLKSQNYPAELVDKQFDIALSIPEESDKETLSGTTLLLVTTYKQTSAKHFLDWHRSIFQNITNTIVYSTRTT